MNIVIGLIATSQLKPATFIVIFEHKHVCADIILDFHRYD